MIIYSVSEMNRRHLLVVVSLLFQTTNFLTCVVTPCNSRLDRLLKLVQIEFCFGTEIQFTYKQVHHRRHEVRAKDMRPHMM